MIARPSYIDRLRHAERLAASLLADGSVRCVLTGSNAGLLASDLGSLLTGTVFEIPVETLLFAELASAKGNGGSEDALARYLRIGGFPILHALGYDEEKAAAYAATLVDAILMRDVVQRLPVRCLLATPSSTIRFAGASAS